MTFLKNTAASIRQKLLNISKQNNLDYNLILTRYSMERLLYRLGISKYSKRFVLKGASLFLIWNQKFHRVTRDADFLGYGNLDSKSLKNIFTEIINIETDCKDGIIFDSSSMEINSIRENNPYHGNRIKLIAKLGNAKIPLQIDIGIGDSIVPEPENIIFPVLLDFPAPRITAYSKYTMIAEKFEAMISLGMNNSRMKDFFDIYVISKLFEFNGSILLSAIESTFKRRNTQLPVVLPVSFTKEFYEDSNKIIQWKAFLKKTKPDKKFINNLDEIINHISIFLLNLINNSNLTGKKNNKIDLVWDASKGWYSTKEEQ